MSDEIRSIYVHVPFCHTLCGYCDFYSVVYDKQAVPPLVDALLAEWRRATETRDLRADTIFVGGGTPTTLPPDQLARLLRALRQVARPDVEFTVEANPATVTPEIAAVLAAEGVNRVSIGAQSFVPGELQVLERIHQPEQVAETIRNCRAAGIERLNVDLIFSIPGQTLAGWRANLRRALDLGTTHLSCYSLTYEPGTRLYQQREQGRITPTGEDLDADMYAATIDDLAAAGLPQYEISNFAAADQRCRHNLVYWNNGSYLGIGPSASGYVDSVRYRNVADHRSYLQAVQAGHAPRIEEERRSPEQAARDAVLLGLRLTEGLRHDAFRQRYGRTPRDLFPEEVARHEQLGTLEVDDEGLRLTRRGMFLADGVIADFL